MSNKLYTIGHSNHDIDTFITLLKQHGVTALADVRSTPYSRYISHFCQRPLKGALQKAGIHYVFLGRELGARPDDERCYVDGKALYERIAATDAFSNGIERIISGIQKFDVALMCAEKDPLICHRAVLVCQHLKPFSLDINHICHNGDLETHQHLEERLLKANGLADALNQTIEEPEPAQLSVFDSSTSTPLSDSSVATLKPLSLAEAIQKAYARQGNRIAYVERNHDSAH
jgi:uncharacterized protein (DUF488 family)